MLEEVLSLFSEERVIDAGELLTRLDTQVSDNHGNPDPIFAKVTKVNQEIMITALTFSSFRSQMFSQASDTLRTIRQRSKVAIKVGVFFKPNRTSLP